VSGPLRPVPATAPPGAVRRGTTGAFERLRALPETRFVDGLLRGRAWIWLIGILLGGIVATQVSLLKLNTGISRAVTTVGTLERQNAELEAEIGRLSSAERISAAASDKGLITPPAGSVEYVRSRSRDSEVAARRMTPPSAAAAAIMANGGREPGVLAAATVLTETVPAADPAAMTTTDPAATIVPEPVATPDPAAAVAPTVPEVAVDPAAGAVEAPQG
jgi:hypothetical protein